MADIEIEAAAPAAVQAAQMAEDSGAKTHPKPAGRLVKKRKQVSRRLHIKDSPKLLVLDHRLRAAPKVPQVGEAHPVNPGRQPTPPAAPDEPRRVEKERGALVHSTTHGWGVTNHQFLERI